MPVETGSYIDSLNATWPLAGESRRQGDDHLRFLKKVIKATFPNLTAPVKLSAAQINAMATNLGIVKATLTGLVSAVAGTDFAKPDTASTWTAPQRTTWGVPEADGTLDTAKYQNFVLTPSDSFTINFVLPQNGQNGRILVKNTANYLAGIAAGYARPYNLANRLSLTGWYLLTYEVVEGTVILTCSENLQ
jgi:hypothetical protein